jgi:hypothetical protein
MTERQVERAWQLELEPDRELGLDCSSARFRQGSLEGYVIFERKRLGSIWVRAGGRTGRGVRVGSTLAELKAAEDVVSVLHGSAPFWEAGEAGPRRGPASDSNRIAQATVAQIA